MPRTGRRASRCRRARRAAQGGGALRREVARTAWKMTSELTMSSLTGVTGMLGLDVRLPTTQANPFWYGFVQLLISAPSKGLNNVFLGQQELTGRPLAQYFPLTFSLPANGRDHAEGGRLQRLQDARSSSTSRTTPAARTCSTTSTSWVTVRPCAAPTARATATRWPATAETGWAGNTCASCAVGLRDAERRVRARERWYRVDLAEPVQQGRQRSLAGLRTTTRSRSCSRTCS